MGWHWPGKSWERMLSSGLDLLVLSSTSFSLLTCNPFLECGFSVAVAINSMLSQGLCHWGDKAFTAIDMAKPVIPNRFPQVAVICMPILLRLLALTR